MFCTLDQLRDYGLRARDGVLGSVEDAIIDERDWSVRYLKVSTGSWLLGREVLLDRDCLAAAEPGRREINVALGTDEIKKAPGEASDPPASKQQKTALVRSYRWVGAAGFGMAAVPPVDHLPIAPESEEPDTHLRSLRELAGYQVLSGEDDRGTLKDALIDVEQWQVAEFMVDVGNGTDIRFLVRPGNIERIDWANRSLLCPDLPPGSADDAPR